MIDIEEQLSQLPYEFREEMQNQKEARWPGVYKYVTRYLNCTEEIEETEEEGFPIKLLLKYFYDMGFFSGVNFTLSPDEPFDSSQEQEHRF